MSVGGGDALRKHIGPRLAFSPALHSAHAGVRALLMPLGAAGAADVSCQDPEYARTRPGFPGEFLAIRDKLIKVSGAPAPVPVQSVMTF